MVTDNSSKWKSINSQSNGQMQENGLFSINSLGYGIRIYVWDATLTNFYTRYIPFAANTPGMGQQFLLSPNQGGAVLATWRFLAVRVDFAADRVTFFLDGRRALDWQVGGGPTHISHPHWRPLYERWQMPMKAIRREMACSTMQTMVDLVGRDP